MVQVLSELSSRIWSPHTVCKPPRTTANHHKSPQTTTNHRKPPQITANHHKSPPEFGTIGSENSGNQANQANHRKPLQTTANHRQNVGQKQVVWLLQNSQALSVEHDTFANSRNTHRPKSCIFTTFRWWFVVICGG